MFLVKKKKLKPFVDWWTVPNTLYGVLAVLVFIILDWNVWQGVLCVFVLAIAWELLQSKMRVEEMITNKITDVLLATTGGAILALIDIRLNLSPYILSIIALVLIAIVIISNGFLLVGFKKGVGKKD